MIMTKIAILYKFWNAGERVEVLYMNYVASFKSLLTEPQRDQTSLRTF